MDQRERFETVVSHLGEHFNDYFLVVRTGSGMIWRSSDASWSIGAVQRYVDHVTMEDRANLVRDMNKENQ